MKKIFVTLIVLISLSIFSQDKILTVGATPVPHAQVLNDVIKPLLAKQGITLVVKEFTDYIQPNLALSNKEIDANFFQHLPFLQTFTKDRGIKGLVAVKTIYLPPTGVYSKKFKNLSELKSGATISIPNDPTNEARSLILLEKAGIIKLKDSNNINSTPRDVVDNPKKVKFVEVDAAQLPRTLDDVDFAVIQANFAMASGIIPSKDSIFLETAVNNPFSNVLATREEKKDDPLIIALANALTSQEVKNYIKNKLNDSLVPAF